MFESSMHPTAQCPEWLYLNSSRAWHWEHTVKTIPFMQNGKCPKQLKMQGRRGSRRLKEHWKCQGQYLNTPKTWLGVPTAGEMRSEILITMLTRDLTRGVNRAAEDATEILERQEITCLIVLNSTNQAAWVRRVMDKTVTPLTMRLTARIQLNNDSSGLLK